MDINKILIKIREQIMAFKDIFRDTNDYNEKSIIGFVAFLIMILIALADVVTSAFGIEISIEPNIYDSFLWLVLGCFGIGGIEKIFGKKQEKKDEEQDI